MDAGALDARQVDHVLRQDAGIGNLNQGMIQTFNIGIEQPDAADKAMEIIGFGQANLVAFFIHVRRGQDQAADNLFGDMSTGNAKDDGAQATGGKKGLQTGSSAVNVTNSANAERDQTDNDGIQYEIVKVQMMRLVFFLIGIVRMGNLIIGPLREQSMLELGQGIAHGNGHTGSTNPGNPHGCIDLVLVVRKGEHGRGGGRVRTHEWGVVGFLLVFVLSITIRVG